MRVRVRVRVRVRAKAGAGARVGVGVRVGPGLLARRLAAFAARWHVEVGVDVGDPGAVQHEGEPVA